MPANPLTRLLFPATAAAALLAAVLPAGPASASTTGAAAAVRPVSPAGPAVPVLRWRPCDTGFQCATARVPLDYRHPRGTMISITLTRHLATDPARRLGSLFFNPGGPGGPGAEELPYFWKLFPAQARARFNIVGFDPRGVGSSTAVRCFASTAAENKFLAAAPAGFPTGVRQVAAWDRVYARFGAICAARNRALTDHDTSADAARDMDLLRRAVHDPVLNYLGISYGTLLGATYANLFPGRVGAMILDGNINPVAWTHGGPLPTALRMGSDVATGRALRAFLNLCGRVPASRCAFSAGTPAATRAKFGTLLARLRRHPVTTGHTTWTYSGTLAAVQGFLATVAVERPLHDGGWPGGARQLQGLWTASAAAGGPVPPAIRQRAPGYQAGAGAGFYNGPEQEYAVICSDSPNPPAARYPRLAALASARGGPTGPVWSWLTEPCASWRGSSTDRYAGPWNRPTAHPVLVIGNTGDPTTPYQDSVAMSHLLARARLLTVAGYGHSELMNPSACAARYESRYLVTGALPRAGTVCRQNSPPFPG